MIKTLILIAVGIFVEQKWSPRLSWVNESKMVLVHYNDGQNGRKYKILFKL